VTIPLRSEMSCSAGTRTIVGDVIDYSALPGSSSLQRAPATISILIIAPANSRFMLTTVKVSIGRSIFSS